jgi:hypothetical protein
VTATIALPDDLAPALAERVQQLLAEVPLVEHPDLVIDLTGTPHTCVVCHLGGKLGGHHGADGRIEWIHKSCHRRLHRRGTPTRKAAVLAHRLALLTAS